MDAKAVLQVLLNKPDTSVSKEQPRDDGREFLWLDVRHTPSNGYISSICINDDGTTSFILPAPWHCDQTGASRLAYDVLGEVYRAMGIKREGDGDVYIVKPNMAALNRGYLLAKNYDSVLRSEAFKNIGSQLEAITRQAPKRNGPSKQ